MNDGRGGDGQEPADATSVMPPGRSGGGGQGTRPAQDVGRQQRPGAPDAPPPPASSFRPSGPPPPAAAFRPGRPVRPTGEEPGEESPDGATQLLGDATEVVRRRDATEVVRRRGAAARDGSGPPAQAPPGGRDYAEPTGQHTGGTYTDSGGHVRPVPGNDGYGGYAGYGEASPRYPADSPGSSGPGGGFHQQPPLGGQQPPGGTGPTPAVPGPAPARRRRRRGRALAFAVVLLLVLFVVGDRVAVAIAKDQMEKQIAVSVAESLEPGATPPTVKSVSIGGFPFLTQVLFGKFKDIGVVIEGIPTPGPRISSVDANLKGVHVPLGDALSDNIGEVPVDRVRATVRITYDDLNSYLADQDPAVQVTPVDGGERVEISSSFAGQEIGGVTTFEVEDNKLTLVPSEIQLRGGITASIPLPSGIRLQSIPIPIGGLPFDLNIVQASTDASGLSLTATAKDVILPAAPEPAGGK
ncbi:Protein of unknown function (DUF2993) [Frankia sp. EI5c]|uniref:LmeA family phospholipid-binding protein n=1 Tax=Frankia sp. EI5c TaxID=683316 RepID=UPI0007C222FE|nr:DUF2993 domain-containing protein [Frankia sp. EI5c]OAA26057.1 Protein of unknown function (DUF2993) [Frankia sp. EI5c]